MSKQPTASTGRLHSPALLEGLEGRRMFSADAVTFVYVETNNSAPNGNAILIYKRDAVNGTLAPAGNAAVYTGGSGYRNAASLLGSDDSDREVIAIADGKFLFAVNQGSDSISTFAIQSNGHLKRLGTFYSGGTQPVSLALDGDHLYVANILRAMRGPLRGKPRRRGTLAMDLAVATKDRYVRTGSKKARNTPVKHKQKPPGTPEGA